MRSTKKTTKKPQKHTKSYRFALFLIVTGVFSIVTGSAILLFTFFPLIQANVQYAAREHAIPAVIQPVDRDFSIVIPKIGANAPVVADVNPNVESEYQQALSQGVAHARGTAYPGQRGNIFLFAHSAQNWYMANRYNALFFLLYKLEQHDDIRIYYKGSLYTYEVDTKVIVEPDELSYLTDLLGGEKLTLMTCWPPGTTLKRLIVTAVPQNGQRKQE